MPPVTSIGTPLIQLDEVDSSNNYAMAQIQAQLAAHGTTWFARHQTAGRGQRGKAWNALPGQNIIISTIIAPEGLPLANQFKLSVAIALACRDFFAAYALADTYIKWPNDIYWKDRKAGGILIENLVQGKEWKYAVVGIGININQVSFGELANAVSLKQITGNDYELLPLVQQLCICLEERWQKLSNGAGDDQLHEYNQNLYKRNENVAFKMEKKLIEGRVMKVSAAGELMVDHGGTITAWPFGSVEWLLD